MQIRYPDYYKKFTCLAGACPDSCCHEWEVDVDPVSADYYRTLPGALGDRLREVLKDGEDGWASMELTLDRRCPMWRDDGLCRIQAEQGHDALCDTCQKFPRLSHDHGDFMELGLELSCPEAARLILAHPHARWITEEVPGGEPPAYEALTMEVFRISREKAVALALDESVSVGEAMASVLIYATRVQMACDLDEIREFDRQWHLDCCYRKMWDGTMDQMLAPYWDLEILTDRWKDFLDRGAQDEPWKTEHRALMRYFIDRYWYMSIYDGEIQMRAMFILLSCLVIRAMGGDTAEMAQLYSKEIENNPDNVEALYDYLMKNETQCLFRLISLALK